MKEEKQMFGTTEWAAVNANFQTGCANGCIYCWSKACQIRWKHRNSSNWHVETVNLKKVNRRFKKEKGTIMFPSTHDINNDNIDYAITFLGNMLRAGNDVLIVSKPHFEVVKRLCTEFSDYKEKILFRFSIGSKDSETLRFWEPNATNYDERKNCLIYAFDMGFKTSVSCEPMLDILESDVFGLVDDLQPFITDKIWIGKVNFLYSRLKINGSTDTETMDKANQLMKSQSDDFIRNLNLQLFDNPIIEWKESIKKILGLKVGTIKVKGV